MKPIEYHIETTDMEGIGELTIQKLGVLGWELRTICVINETDYDDCGRSYNTRMLQYIFMRAA